VTKLDVLCWLDYRTRFLTHRPAGIRLRHVVRQLADRTGPLEVVADGLSFTGGIGDREYLRALAAGQWERLNISLFQSAIEPGMTVADVGAHIGYYSLIAAKIVGPRGRVLAFEPNPESRRLLELNAVRNGLDGLMTISPIALSDGSGSAAFHLAPGNRSGSSLFVEHDYGQTLEVKTGRLDDLIPGDSAIDVMKMDVEGGEVRALVGMPRTLSRVQRLCIECNPPYLRAAGSSAGQLIEILREAGLQVQAVDEGRQRLRSVEEGDLTDGYLNLYASRG
jgi:FkbM family methyltransferase